MGDEALTVGAVARRLGVAVTTLRTWHQRYGLGPSGHLPGHHRRYTPDDLARLELMWRLTAEGVAPAEAAQWALRTPAEPPGGRPPGSRRGAARGLARAAARLDVGAMREIMSRSIAENGVVSTWDRVVRPVLAGIGSRGGIEVEHLFSRTTTEVLAAVPRPPAGDPPRILLACADEEQHSLPLEALAAALAAEGVPSRLLGARVPPAALGEAVARTGPDVVMIWSHAAATADVTQLTALRSTPRRPLSILAGGPGWTASALPAGVVAPGSLAEAVRLAEAWTRPVRSDFGRRTAL